MMLSGPSLGEFLEKGVEEWGEVEGRGGGERCEWGEVVRSWEWWREEQWKEVGRSAEWWSEVRRSGQW